MAGAGVFDTSPFVFFAVAVGAFIPTCCCIVVRFSKKTKEVPAKPTSTFDKAYPDEELRVEATAAECPDSPCIFDHVAYISNFVANELHQQGDARPVTERHWAPPSSLPSYSAADHAEAVTDPVKPDQGASALQKLLLVRLRCSMALAAILADQVVTPPLSPSSASLAAASWPSLPHTAAWARMYPDAAANQHGDAHLLPDGDARADVHGELSAQQQVDAPTQARTSLPHCSDACVGTSAAPQQQPLGQHHHCDFSASAYGPGGSVAADGLAGCLLVASEHDHILMGLQAQIAQLQQRLDELPEAMLPPDQWTARQTLLPGAGMPATMAVQLHVGSLVQSPSFSSVAPPSHQTQVSQQEKLKSRFIDALPPHRLDKLPVDLISQDCGAQVDAFLDLHNALHCSHDICCSLDSLSGRELEHSSSNTTCSADQGLQRKTQGLLHRALNLCGEVFEPEGSIGRQFEEVFPMYHKGQCLPRPRSTWAGAGAHCDMPATSCKTWRSRDSGWVQYHVADHTNYS